MGAYEGKIFKSGNSVALRLPKELGFAADTLVLVEERDGVVTFRRKVDPAIERQKVLDFVAALRALPSVEKIGERPPWDWPDRGGRT